MCGTLTVGLRSVNTACLTFEVRRDQREDARPGRKDDRPHLEAGPGGLPLGLASTEGLGLGCASMAFADFA